MKFLFWNVGDPKAENPGLPVLVSRLAGTYQPDLLFLFEAGQLNSPNADVARRSHDLAANLLRELRPSGYAQVDLRLKGGLLFSRIPPKRVVPVTLNGLPGNDPDRRRLDAVHLTGGDPQVLVFAVHAPSKLHATEHDQQLFCSKLRRVVARAERDLVVDHSVLLGDFNADPFEPAVAAAPCLHAVMTRDLLGRVGRRVRGERFGGGFYNPMWALYGDATVAPPGTYYYDPGRAHQVYWHMFDQVLVRPGLVRPGDDRLGPVRILSEVTPRQSLVRGLTTRRRRGDPPRPDHLPVVFDLDI